MRVWLKDVMGEQWIETDPGAAMCGYDPEVYSPPSIKISMRLFARYQAARAELEAVWAELYAIEDAQTERTPDGLVARRGSTSHD